MCHLSSKKQYAMIAAITLVLITILAIFIARSALVTASPVPRQPQPTNVIAKGVQGYVIGTSTPQAGIFRGIPFSQPPTGDFRWRNPRKPVPFDGNVWNATYNRPGCSQACNYKSKQYTCPTETSEDCLYLNVWVPKTVLKISDGSAALNESHYVIAENFLRSDEDSLAVIVYLHGGNYVSGAGSALIYDGRFLVEQGNVVFVTTNYRLGAFGFLVQGDGEDAATGNFGIWDQISALKWVQQNIKFFGGNPKKVTVFGQSSGAESVGVLMTSKHSRGLFHRAILSSNPLSLPLRNVNGAQQYGDKFANALGCEPNNMVCLRAANVDSILEASKVSGWSFLGSGKKLFAIQPWGPVIDGDFLVETPLDAFRKGHAAKLPVIVGVTADEGMFFVPFAISFPLSTMYYQFGVGLMMGSHSTAVLNEYPAKCQSNCDNRYKVSDIITDYVFICPSRSALNSSTSESWFYVFDQTLPFEDLWESDLCNSRACHCADLPYIFDNVDLSKLEFSQGDRMLARRMGFYWTNFAKYGNPNGNGEFLNKSGTREERFHGLYNASFWPQFSLSGYGSYSAIKFKSKGDATLSDPYLHKCDFWDNLSSYGQYR